MAFTYHGSNKQLTDQSKEIVANVHKYLQKTLINSDRPISVLNEVSKATGISQNRIAKVIKESKNAKLKESSYTTYKLKYKSEKINLSDTDKSAIRKCIRNLLLERSQLLTLDKIYNKVITNCYFKGDTGSLYDIIKSLGFKWKNMGNDKWLLIEKPESANDRIEYLRTIMKMRNENKNIFFIDETNVSIAHVLPNETFLNINGEKRLHAVHACCANGFLPNALLFYKSPIATHDFYENICFKNIEDWLTTKLIPNIPPESIIVIVKMPFYEEIINSIPSLNSKKQKMMDWLDENNIEYSTSLLKPELYNLIRCNKPIVQKYKIDHIFEKYRIPVLRIPKNHTDLNPMENVWSSLEDYVRKSNIDFNLESIKKLIIQGIAQFSIEKLQREFQNVSNIEFKYFNDDNILDVMLDEDCFTNIGEVSSAESSDEIIIDSE